MVDIANALAIPRARRLAFIVRSVPIERLIPRTTGYVPLVTAAAVGFGVLIPVVELCRYALSSPDPARTYTGVAVTLAYLPLHIRHIWYVARGIRPPQAPWTVAMMAAVIVGSLPYLGALWLGQFHALAVSVLIVLGPPWSVVLFCLIVAAQAPLAIALGHAGLAPFFTLGTALKGLPVFLLIWLVGAVRRLAVARRALADREVGRERSRIDEELRRTVGAALESIATRGEAAGALATRDPAAAQDELRRLVQASRATLAETRGVIRGYQHSSLSTELDSAAALLLAAGIDCRVVLPDGEVPDSVDLPVRAALRDDVARLLQDDTVRQCVIEVTHRDGRLRLTVHVGSRS